MAREGEILALNTNTLYCQNIQELCHPPTSTFREIVSQIDKHGKGIILITDEKQELLGTITDGDVRRWLIGGDSVNSLDAPVQQLLELKKNTLYPNPVTAPSSSSRESLLRLMQERVLHQIPLLNPLGQVVDLATMDDLLPEKELPLQAVVMAGGFGTRLRPLTVDLPKPMLPMGDRPLLEWIICQLRSAGIRRINVTTYYMAEKIIEHFGNGDKFGVDLKYVAENQPLGTAGAIGLLDEPKEPLLVMNGDVLTSIDFRAMLAYHQEHQATLTVGVRKYELKVPYGVIDSDGPYVRKIEEKPTLTFFVNAGIYLLQPDAYCYIPKNMRFDMTDLIERLIQANHHVACFPILEYWLDIGEHVDYQKAIQDLETGRFAA